MALDFRKDDEIETEDELLQQVTALSPLSALDPEMTAKVSPLKRRFLLAFINTGSIVQARKQTGVKLGLWRKWQTDPDFIRVFEVVKNPIALTYNLYQVIALKAAMKHLALLDHPSVKIQQWAIERSNAVMTALSREEKKANPNNVSITFQDMRGLAEQAIEALPESQRKLLQRGPFDTSVVEGQIVSSVPLETNDSTNADKPRTGIIELPDRES